MKKMFCLFVLSFFLIPEMGFASPLASPILGCQEGAPFIDGAEHMKGYPGDCCIDGRAYLNVPTTTCYTGWMERDEPTKEPKAKEYKIDIVLLPRRWPLLESSNPGNCTYFTDGTKYCK